MTFLFSDEETQIENERYAVSEQFQQTENTANFLLKGLTFYISRECPQYAMEFIVMSMSGTIVDEPEKATHIVTDRSPEHIVFKKNKVDFLFRNIFSLSGSVIV